MRIVMCFVRRAAMLNTAIDLQAKCLFREAEVYASSDGEQAHNCCCNHFDSEVRRLFAPVTFLDPGAPRFYLACLFVFCREIHHRPSMQSSPPLQLSIQNGAFTRRFPDARARRRRYSERVRAAALFCSWQP